MVLFSGRTIILDSNGENFMDAEISHLPAIDHKPRLVSAAPRRENTYRMDKKVSEGNVTSFFVGFRIMTGC